MLKSSQNTVLGKRGMEWLSFPSWICMTLLFSLSWMVLCPLSASSGSSSSTNVTLGKNIDDCAKRLSHQDGGWCEIRVSEEHPSISSVWPEKLPGRTRMVVGPASILTAWNSAAFDEEGEILYFMGGGHSDYGGNEVYAFHLMTGAWERLTDPAPLDHFYIAKDYGDRKNKPWRRLCWMPDIAKSPGSSHTYDGLIFSQKTKTIFLYSYGAANGSCVEDKEDKYKDSPLVLGDRFISFGWYEFNPSKKDTRNGLAPLSWHKVFDKRTLEKYRLHQSYPVSAQLSNGDIVFGSKLRTGIFDPANVNEQNLKGFSGQADWGDGLLEFDKKRKRVWAIHEKSLLAYNEADGRLVANYRQVVPHGKSIAFDKNGLLVSWDGGSNVYVFNPDEPEPRWKLFDWGENGPPTGSRRVYGKWVYVSKYDLFVGLSVHTTGVWVYKSPIKSKPISYSTENVQDFLKGLKPGDRVTITPGVYGQGLFINQSVTVDLKGVSFRGVAKSKGIVNVNCNNCDVTILNLEADGRKAGCLWGNCAGIKAEGKGFRLTVKNAHINNTVMGVLTDNRGGTLIMEDSLIENSGLNDRSKTLGHGFYAGDISKVVLRNTTIRRSFGKGHIFKSRAPDTLIENSVLSGLDGRHSRIIDFPCGGKLHIRNSVLQQGEQTDNIDLISVGTEPQYCGGSVYPSDVTIRNSWLIFDRDESTDEPASNHGFNRVFTWRAPISNLDVTDNRIVESTGRMRFDGEDHIPDLSANNRMFKSRKAAGLGPVEIPHI